ncbi:hypothetical protein C0V75_04995 [Tabrizicola sp. TH137]|uniref:hypothetical protein n=1 Tax=Tabrizicola sp. TH137 TaxID=2067452 RepID=UPI000C7D71E5|nr:hypothetical protein [Tabrizicola sp. TH137]PLL14771.1 hypothetical protein C0V75_04995 [Tabrizicola sp. TH137]
MNILRLLTLALRGCAVSAPPRLSREARDKALVAAASHGNLRLQFGQFFVKADVDAKFARYRQKGVWQ